MSNKTVQHTNMTRTDDKGNVLKAPADVSSSPASLKWWKLDEDQMAAAISSTIQFMADHQGGRLTQLTTNTRLYGHSEMYGMVGASSVRGATSGVNASDRISYNVCQSSIDTVESKMAKNKVIPTYITNGGDWSAQKKSKQLTKFAQGVCYQEKVHFKSVQALKDCSVWGDGFVYVYNKDGKVAIERVLPHELYVDMIESMCAEPTQLHRVKFVDRDTAREMFPELEEAIDRVSPVDYKLLGSQQTSADLIQVNESWHLRSGEKAKDGKHVISVGDGAIVEDYEEDYFPFPHMVYSQRQLGYYGQGICERLENIQTEINRCMILKQRSLYMMSSFKVLLEKGSKVVSQHLDNTVGSIIHYVGTEPKYITPPATNPELQLWIDTLISYAYRQEGISLMNSTGEVPAGVESGKAMRTYSQINDDRHMYLAQKLEDFVLEIVRQAINVVKKIYKEKGHYEVIFPNTNFLETIDWKDVNLDEEQYVLKAYPTSSLSDDLTGRLAEIQELIQGGFVSQRTGYRLLGMPDIEAQDALANGPENRIYQILEEMLDDKKVVRFQPEFHNEEIARRLSLEFINYAEYMNCPEDRIQLVRDYLSEINAVAAEREALMAQQVPGGGNQLNPGTPSPGLVPQANPEPAPQSNMIPNNVGGPLV